MNALAFFIKFEFQNSRIKNMENFATIFLCSAISILDPKINIVRMIVRMANSEQEGSDVNICNWMGIGWSGIKLKVTYMSHCRCNLTPNALCSFQNKFKKVPCPRSF